MLDTKEQLKELSSALTFAADFKDYFRQILEMMEKMKAKNKEEMMTMLNALKKMFDQMSIEIKQGNMGDMDAKKKEMMAYCEKEMNKMMLEHETMMSVVDRKMSEVKDGLDADEDRVAENASKMAITACLDKVVAKKDDLKGEVSKLGDLIADTISGLLEIKDIKGLQKILDELRQLRGRTLGGGTNYMGVNQHFIDPYVPTGTVNGVNTDFVCSTTPNPAASLKVYRGGALQSLTEDYTLSGKTITFLVAPVVGEIIKVEHRA